MASSLRRTHSVAKPRARPVIVHWLGVALAVLPQPSALAQPDAALAAAVAATHRSPQNVARDRYRHPVAVLGFLGVRPTDTVVEILPGSSAYYMEILAPYLRDHGRYIAADRDETAPPRYLEDHGKMLAKIAAHPDTLGKVIVTKFNADRHEIAPPGSADFVLTFRNLHNWIERGEIDAALRSFHRALKPGGVLGVVDHRGRTDRSQEEQRKSGYVREDYAIAIVERAGFALAGRSEANANPRDTKDHPEGVWSLPPALRLKDRDREKYLAIGESDRFTLRFVKR
jgi:predicted methyltransferase